MKKIGIVTLNGYFNFGNRLQNFALQEVIKDMGYDVTTILINDEVISNNKNILEKIRGKSIKTIIDILKLKLGKKTDQEREELFKKFTLDYINESNFSIDENSIPSSLSSDFSFFVTGSDQVWNPNYRTNPSLYFLSFANKDQRVAYAPSFGVSKIDENKVSIYTNLINGMSSLSVREDRGSEIVKELTNRKAPVHVDPTFLLTKERWLDVSSPISNKESTPFILTYFLGGIPKVHRKKIKDIAKKDNLRIINLGDRKDRVAYKNIGPSEFIDLVNNAELFCTDSFHGVVFSILFETPFIVYQREGSTDMYSRIDTLLNKFSLGNRTIDSINFDLDIYNVDYGNSSLIIESERNRSFDYLKKSFDTI